LATTLAAGCDSASSGCRAFRSSTTGVSTISTGLPSYATASRAAAARASIAARVAAVRRSGSATAATSAVSCSRIRLDSRRISSSVTLSRLFTATSAVGSTNTVSPVREVSCTMPSPSDFALAFSGST
jgi:hypothetical protein